jgi:hypothetical protein
LEKDIPEAQGVLDRKIELITKNAEQLYEMGRLKQKNLEVIVQTMREKLRYNQMMQQQQQMQQQQAAGQS